MRLIAGSKKYLSDSVTVDFLFLGSKYLVSKIDETVRKTNGQQKHILIEWSVLQLSSPSSPQNRSSLAKAVLAVFHGLRIHEKSAVRETP
jgi:hypothetical protein